MLRFFLPALLAASSISPNAKTGFFPTAFKKQGAPRGFMNAVHFAILLVDARKLQTSTFKGCLSCLRRSQAEHNLFGHVWILLVDRQRGQLWECGYSGEVEGELPGYLRGLGLMLEGLASDKMLKCGADLRNPISYLFTERKDGYLQWGDGGHTPNCAVGFALTVDQFTKMTQMLSSWNQNVFSLQRANCVHFALQLARSANLILDCPVEQIHIPKTMRIGSCRVVLRRDAAYRTLSVKTPASLRRSLIRRFSKQEIDSALQWYQAHKR